MHNNRYQIKARVPNELGGFRVWTIARNVQKERIAAIIQRAGESVRGLECWRVPMKRETGTESK